MSLPLLLPGVRGPCAAAEMHRARRHRASRATPLPASLRGTAEADWALVGPLLLPAFLELARGIEAQWQQHPACAGLVPLPADARFAAVQGGAEDSRIVIQNRFYTAPPFRKCHLELAAGAKQLSVLHCVMFPWAAVDLPLFSVDMVAFGVRRRHESLACVSRGVLVSRDVRTYVSRASRSP